MIERPLNPHAQNVLSWRESLSTMPDSHFFELIHMYLGEVKTPYNKQKLIEELSSFIRKEENINTAFNLLSENDILLLNGINFIPNPTQEKLSTLFSSTFSFADLYEHLINLEERLLIYKKTDYLEHQYYSINPLFEAKFKSILHISYLLPKPKQDSQTAVFSNTSSSSLSNVLLAAVYSFVNNNPDLRKNDGTFKKKIETLIPTTFSQINSNSYLLKLIQSLINLSLLTQTDSNLSVNKQKWINFSKLTPQEQYVYISVSTSKFNQDLLTKYATLLTSILKNIPDTGYPINILYRCAYLIYEQLNSDNDLPKKRNRLIAILDNDQKNDYSDNSLQLIKHIINNAIEFGLLQKCAMDAYDNPIYKVADFYTKEYIEDENPAINIEAGFSVMILPNISLEKLLTIIDCMELINVDTVLQMVITRKACMKCFDFGYTPTQLIENLNKNCLHELPSSLSFSLEDWYNHYQSATMYFGYVLKVAESKQIAIENNPEISQHIKQILAPGIYLLDYNSIEQLQQSIDKSQIDFIGSIQTSAKSIQNSQLVFLNQKDNYYQTVLFDSSDTTNIDNKQFNCETILTNLQSELENMDISKEQFEGLRNRIIRKIIISKSQLRAESVKPEKTEAFGMDYSGKIHIVEAAIVSHSLIEITYDNPQLQNGTQTLIANPISIIRDINDTYINVLIEPTHVQEKLSLGTARYVKRIRGSIIKETSVL